MKSLEYILKIIIPSLCFIACAEDNPKDMNFVALAGNITKDMTLKADIPYLLTAQTFVQAGATLTIEPGTTIRAMPYDQIGLAPVLVIMPGARILAEGTEQAPITFTSAIMTDSMTPSPGLWGGLFVLGHAPINEKDRQVFAEGLAGIPFGGNDPDDNSGILRYVRVWYGGRPLTPDNKINGITFGGVGRATVVEHCEVAFNLDDGIRFVGGTVNAKYLSVLFSGDDAVDIDLGYQGSIQYLFVMLSPQMTGRAIEMDSNVHDVHAQPRTFAKFSNMTLVGPGPSRPIGDGADQMIALSSGAGGDFRNTVIVNGNGYCLQLNGEASLDLLKNSASSSQPNICTISPQTVTFGCVKGSLHSDIASSLTVNEQDPMLTSVAFPPVTALIDPRPKSGSFLIDGGETVYPELFFDKVNFSGAFSGKNLWLKDWSWIDERGMLAP